MTHQHGGQDCDPSEAAAIAQFGREIAGDDPRNLCARCGRIVVVEFIALPELWSAAAGKYEHEHLCITCFDALVPTDWPVQWESVTTLWPISRKRALLDAGLRAAAPPDSPVYTTAHPSERSTFPAYLSPEEQAIRAAAPQPRDATLDKLRALEAKATPGPWRYHRSIFRADDKINFAYVGFGKNDGESGLGTGTLTEEDARFLAAAVEYVRSLIRSTTESTE